MNQEVPKTVYLSQPELIFSLSAPVFIGSLCLDSCNLSQCTQYIQSHCCNLIIPMALLETWERFLSNLFYFPNPSIFFGGSGGGSLDVSLSV